LRNRDDFNYKIGDFIGQAGIEEQYDNDLRGEDGFEFVEVDAQGRMKRASASNALFKDIENNGAIPGNNVRLTIDRDMQLAAYKALEGKQGSAVAVDVNTGEILTMVSRPSFDPGLFSRGISNEDWDLLAGNDANPLRDRTVQEHYPPGSTFKTFTALAALQEGIVDINTEVNCPGYFYLGKRRFHCWKKHGHGKVDVIKAVRESCDVYFYKIATKMDIDTLAKYAIGFGFGRKSGISLPRETMGLIPTKEWKIKRNGQEWQLGETLSCVIGQSYVLSTSLQLAMAYATLANGGTLYKPYILKEIIDSTGETKIKKQPEKLNQIQFDKKNLDMVKKGLFEVVNTPKGTAWWYKGKGNNMSGKTGTVQLMRISADKIFQKCEEREFKTRHHGLFAAFAPSDNPKIAIGVIVEHGCHGSSAAAPVASAIVDTYLTKYYPELKKEFTLAERGQGAPIVLPKKVEEDDLAPEPTEE
jgi:penicillin-binding protein 2